jgi:hypothetical protein
VEREDDAELEFGGHIASQQGGHLASLSSLPNLSELSVTSADFYSHSLFSVLRSGTCKFLKGNFARATLLETFHVVS